MSNPVGTLVPVDGRFRPESISHFKEVAKNVAWLLDRPVQRCQEDLARIYGYSGLHELQQVLKKPGVPGPFDPRYSYLSSDGEALVEDHDQRTFFILFGAPKRYWRDDYLAPDKCFLVFEMGLFQEAAEHRACVEKIKQVLGYEVGIDKWPLIHGWPLGLKSWLASGYTESVDLAEGWQKLLPRSRYVSMEHADIRWQRYMTGLVRLATVFQILSPRIGARKPNGIGKVSFDKFDTDGGGITDPSWETDSLVEWLTKKLSQETGVGIEQQKKLIQSFVERPSRATAAACEFVKCLKDPVAFRDRWAFECLKAALKKYGDKSKAVFCSTLEAGAIQSLFLHMAWDSAEISESYGGQLWQFNCTWSEIVEPVNTGCKPKLQPLIHATGSLLVPYDDNLVVMSREDWYFCHDDSEFSSEAAAVAFDEIYLPAIGMKQLDFVSYRSGPHSIIEIDELLLAEKAGVETLKAYFVRLVGSFDGDYLPDSYGHWTETLSLTYDDEEENEDRNQDFEYADYVASPSVLLIRVEGCGLNFVKGTHRNGNLVSSLKRDARRSPAASAEALAALVMEAIKELDVDVVVYDGKVDM